MMKHLTATLILITFSFAVHAQIINRYSSFFADSIKNGQSELCIDNYYYAASNALPLEFVQALYNGDFINDNLKREANLKGENYFGGDLSNSIRFRFRADSLIGISNSVISFSLSNHNFTEIKFNDDYFTLLFFGNSAIAQADLNDFNFRYLNYQKFSLGFSKTFTSTNANTTIGIRASLLKGQKFYSMKIDRGYFNTIDQGIELDGMMDYEFRSSDTTHYGLEDFNGLGFAADLYLRLANPKTGNIFSVELSDLGSINWNDQSLKVAADTSFSFDGEDIDNLLDYSFSNFSELDEDSLRQDFYYSKSKLGTTSTRIPTKVSVSYLHNINFWDSKLLLSTQFYPFSDIEKPHMLVRYAPRFKKVFSPILQISHGGYTDTQLGFGIETLLWKKFSLFVFSANLPGFFSGSEYSQHLRVAVRFRFGKH